MKIPQVGAPLPSVATPTTADPRGVDPICTRDPAVPVPRGRTSPTALSPAGPTVLLISTPLYCQTAICGPVLDLLIDGGRAARRTSTSSTPRCTPTPTPVDSIVEAHPGADRADAYGMLFEPCLFVADATGTIVRRLDLIWDATELDERSTVS